MKFIDPRVFWLVTGLLLTLSELVVPGFVIIFFGLGAILLGLLLLLIPMSMSWQLLVFTVMSLLSLILCRRFMPKTLYGREKKGSMPDETLEYAGELATVTEAIEPGHPGKIHFHDSNWTATCEQCCQINEIVRIVRRDNVTFEVTK